MARSPFGTLACRALATAFTVVVFAGPAAAQRVPSGDADGGLIRAADIERPPSSSRGQTLDQMPMSLQAAVDRVLTRGDVNLRIERQGDSAFVATAHRLHYTLSERGSTLMTPDGSRWSFALTAAGRSGESLPLDLDRIEQPQPNELRVVRAGLTEWYVNGRRGLEQGWTIGSRPAGAGPLLLTFAENGSLQAVAGADDRTLSLGAGLSFAGLQALDAAGRDLPVRFVPGPDRILRIEVDDRVATYPIVIDPTVFEPETTVVITVPIRVALSADGNRALVGTWPAPYAFSRVGGIWQVDGPLFAMVLVGTNPVPQLDPYGTVPPQGGHPLTPASYSDIGNELALSADGNAALVGHHFSFTNLDNTHGAVYYFRRTCCSANGLATWTPGKRLTIDNNFGDRDQFGLSLALSGDGTTALVSGLRYLGADYREVKLFQLDASGSWIDREIVAAGVGVGHSLALSADGNTALISDEAGGGVIWQRPAWFYLFSRGDLLGSGVGATGVALSSDGRVAAIGPDAGGQVYVYTRLLPTGPWIPEVLNCGMYSVALSGDGNTVLCPGFDPVVGSIPPTPTVWTRADRPDVWSTNNAFTRPAFGGSLFGAATALSGNGRVAVVISPDGEKPSYAPCAPGASCPRNQGAVYFFSRDIRAIGTVPPGGSLSTDAGAGATTEHPGQVTVTSPTGGSVSLRVTAPTMLPIDGFSILGVQFDIAAPSETAANPLRISFELHRSLFCDPILCPDPRLVVPMIDVFRTEVPAGAQLVPNCLVLDGTATDDPCVASRTTLANGNARIVVLTSSASLWNFGISTDTPVPDHITLSPATATIAAGGSQVYTVQVLDAFNNGIGDVTTSTTYSISPDGSCLDETCTATAAGPHTVTATYGGLTATATLNVNKGSTPFTFQGFFAPIDMSTASVVWNTVKAGQAVPVKWLLTLDGAPVSDPASFAGLVSYQIPCPSGAGSIDDPIEEIATGDSGLQYNGDGSWQFNWKTLSSYKNTCRSVAVKFSDGTTSPAANFNFKLK